MTESAIARRAVEIREALRSVGTGSRQGHRPSAQSDFGVYKAEQRRITREQARAIKSWPGADVIALARALRAQNIVESRHVGYELIERHKAAREALTIEALEALGEGLDNWACVDSFCTSLVGTAWREGRIGDDDIRRWADSEDLWWRRAAVVATVPLNLKSRGGTGDTPRTLEICERLLDDREVMVQKAISWALRELVPWDREAVVAFLAEHEARLAARVRREVHKKLTTGKKNG